MFTDKLTHKLIPDVVVSRHRGALEWLAVQLAIEFKDVVAHVIVHWSAESTRLSKTIEFTMKEMLTPGVPKRIIIPIIDGEAKAEDVVDRVVLGNVPMKLATLAKCIVAIEFDGAPPRGFEYGVEEMIACGAKLSWYIVRQLPFNSDTPTMLVQS